MSRGKFLSLEEARQSGDFKQFCKEHPEKADRERFLKLLSAMSRRGLVSIFFGQSNKGQTNEAL